ncbi:MAG: restriction endonuclease [Calothrix sp. C42_A2020_038]|nr:restriction endonuclease [Calothrix sp. C42_A2020_038]
MDIIVFGFVVFILIVHILEHLPKPPKINLQQEKINLDLYLHDSQILKKIDLMTGQQFENFIISILDRLGYVASETATTRDFGADCIIIKGSTTIVGQIKRSKKKVGVKAVQEVVGAVKHYDADKAIVISNNYFSEEAHQLANSNDVELWNRLMLMELIQCAKKIE